jgi:hypothetical protein
MQHSKPETSLFYLYDYPLLACGIVVSLIAIPANWRLSHLSIPESGHPIIDLVQRVFATGFFSLLPIFAPIVLALRSPGEPAVYKVGLIVLWVMAALWSAVAVLTYDTLAFMEPGTGSVPSAHTMAAASAIGLTPWQYVMLQAGSLSLVYFGTGLVIYATVKSIRERWLAKSIADNLIGGTRGVGDHGRCV